MHLDVPAMIPEQQNKVWLSISRVKLSINEDKIVTYVKSKQKFLHEEAIVQEIARRHG